MTKGAASTVSFFVGAALAAFIAWAVTDSHYEGKVQDRDIVLEAAADQIARVRAEASEQASERERALEKCKSDLDYAEHDAYVCKRDR